ncbi:conserved hypothetical protein [Corynebacterium striatum]|nr:conserved hypothetical protein [Corynebacterium striatum]
MAIKHSYTRPYQEHPSNLVLGNNIVIAATVKMQMLGYLVNLGFSI